MSGSGDVDLTGSATTQHVSSSGSGNYHGANLTTEDAEIVLSGSGSAQVNVAGRLTATTNGSGDITYAGNPAAVDADSSGSGTIGQE
jgi:hypothetical protein